VRDALVTFVGFDLHKRYITACALTPARSSPIIRRDTNDMDAGVGEHPHIHGIAESDLVRDAARARQPT
jgi:hypothetical protein